MLTTTDTSTWTYKELIECSKEKRAALFRSLFNSYETLPVLIDIWAYIPEDEWLSLLGECWSGCDNIGLYLDELLESPLCGDILDEPKLRQEMMTNEELLAYHALPDELIIYRGCYQHNKWGLSWSLNRDIAARFPFLSRYRGKEKTPLLVTAKVHKDNIIAVKQDRNESEVIAYRPRHVSTRHLPLPV